jgi:hypothetical protein
VRDAEAQKCAPFWLWLFRLAVIEGFLDTNTTPPTPPAPPPAAAAAESSKTSLTTTLNPSKAQGLTQPGLVALLEQLLQRALYFCTAVLHSDPRRWVQYKEELGGCCTIPFFLGGAAEEFLHQRYLAATAAAAGNEGVLGGGKGFSSSGIRSDKRSDAGVGEISALEEAAGAAQSGVEEGLRREGSRGGQSFIAPASAPARGVEGGAAGATPIPHLVCRLALPKFTLKSMWWMCFGLMLMVRSLGQRGPGLTVQYDTIQYLLHGTKAYSNLTSPNTQPYWSDCMIMWGLLGRIVITRPCSTLSHMNT